MFISFPCNLVVITEKASRQHKRNIQIKSDCEARACSWLSVIDDERRFVKVILLIINAAVALVAKEQRLDISASDLFSEKYFSRARRQAAHAYHSLYRGDLDAVIVEQSGDASLSGRFGVITQFLEPTSKLPSGSYVTRLRTKKSIQPTLYSGKKRFISPEYLQAHVLLGTKKKPLPLCHSIAIAYEESNGTNKVFSFIITRATIDGLFHTLPADESAYVRFVEQYLPSRRGDIFVGNAGAHVNLKLHKSSNHDRSRYFKRDGIFRYSFKRSRNGVCIKNTPSVQQCPCHQSLTCEFRELCGPCSESYASDPFLKSSVPAPKHDDGFNMDLVLRPDERVIECPFVTQSAIVPNAALYLNELNIMASTREIVPEETIMTRLSKFVDSITNRDVFSLYPHHNISVPIFNLLLGW